MQKITISGTGGRTDYHFTVDGTIEGTNNLNGADSHTDTEGDGAVIGGEDAYYYTGTITALEVDGNATVGFGTGTPPSDGGDSSDGGDGGGVSSNQPTFGAWFGTPTDGSDPSADYEDWLGREVTYGEGFVGRQGKFDLPGWFSSPWGQWVGSGENRRMNIDTHIKDFATLEEAANGAVDDEYRALGNSLVENNLDNSSIRIICEYDLDFTVHPQTSQEKQWFKQFWRRTADILHSIDGGNLKTVLSPNGDVFETEGYLESTYPGDEYVDQLGLSIYDLDYSRYDPGATLTRSDHEASWQGKTLPNLNSMKEFADSHGKEMAIPEWGCWERSGQQGHGGGDNAYYIQQMHDWMVENDVAWHCYFESLDKHSLQPPTKFPDASEKFKQLFG